MQKFDPGVIGEALYALQKDARQVALVSEVPLIGSMLSAETVLAAAPAAPIFSGVENKLSDFDADNHSVLHIRPIQLNVSTAGTARSIVLTRSTGAVIYVATVEALEVDSGSIIETPAFDMRLNASGA